VACAETSSFFTFATLSYLLSGACFQISNAEREISLRSFRNVFYVIPKVERAKFSATSAHHPIKRHHHTRMQSESRYCTYRSLLSGNFHTANTRTRATTPPPPPLTLRQLEVTRTVTNVNTITNSIRNLKRRGHL